MKVKNVLMFIWFGKTFNFVFLAFISGYKSLNSAITFAHSELSENSAKGFYVSLDRIKYFKDVKCKELKNLHVPWSCTERNSKLLYTFGDIDKDIKPNYEKTMYLKKDVTKKYYIQDLSE